MIWETVVQPFADFGFMRRALLGCVAISLGATPIGVFLMLRRISLTGCAMASAVLPGAATGYLIFGLSLVPMTFGGLGAGLTVALLSGFVTRRTQLREDSSLAAFSLIALALGVLIVSMRGNNMDLMRVLFGMVLALDDTTLILLCSITSFSLLALALLLRPLVLECVDPQFLRSVSKLSALTHFTFLVLVVLNLVGGFHALGTLMAVGIMLLPATAGRFWTNGISSLIIVAIIFAMLSSFTGLLLSYHYNLPSGPAIILVNSIVYVMSFMFGPVGGIVSQVFLHRHVKV